MDKGDFSKLNFVKVENFLEDNNAPQCLQEELYEYASYFKNYSWSEKATYESYSNGAYIGMKKNGKRHGVGMYVFNDSDVYIGDWVDGNCEGYGFYYYYSQGIVYWGQWKNDEREGKGHIWGPGYESEGMYSNGQEIKNMYVRNNGRYSQSSGGSSGNGGCLPFLFFVVIIFVLAQIIL